MPETKSGEPIQIVFAADSNYVMPLTVALSSVAANCDKHRQLLFRVFHQGITRELQQKVEVSLERVRAGDAEIHWREVRTEHVSDLRLVHPYMTSLIYVRLLLGDLLPSDVAKVLYLDADIVVRGDVAQVWDFDVSERTLLAVRDRIGIVSAPGGLAKYRELGIPANAKYFNSGVLLINLARWRARDTTRRVLDYLRTYADSIQMGDQDGLNAVLYDDWGEMEFRWNWQVVPKYLGRPEPVTEPSRPEEKSLIHFVTSAKPWLPACDYDERRYFYEYLDRTEWAGWRVPAWKEGYVQLKRRTKKFLSPILAKA